MSSVQCCYCHKKITLHVEDEYNPCRLYVHTYCSEKYSRESHKCFYCKELIDENTVQECKVDRHGTVVHVTCHIEYRMKDRGICRYCKKAVTYKHKKRVREKNPYKKDEYIYSHQTCYMINNSPNATEKEAETKSLVEENDEFLNEESIPEYIKLEDTKQSAESRQEPIDELTSNFLKLINETERIEKLSNNNSDPESILKLKLNMISRFENDNKAALNA